MATLISDGFLASVLVNGDGMVKNDSFRKLILYEEERWTAWKTYV